MEFLGKSRKFKRFFSPKTGDLQKKKVFTAIETEFSAKIGNSNAFSGRITTSTSQLRYPISFRGGAVFIFSPKIDLKSTKNVPFCILYRPMGGLEPPRPPWLRYCFQRKKNSFNRAKNVVFFSFCILVDRSMGRALLELTKR